MRRLSLVVPLAALAVAAPTAHAQQALNGTVVAPPAVHGAEAVVPLVTAAGAPVKVVVPARGAIVARSGRLTAGQLRFGDKVRATARKLAGKKPHATRLVVTARGATQTFDQIADTQRGAVSAAQAAATAAQSAQQQGAGSGSAQDPEQQREQLEGVRDATQAVVLSLRSMAGQLDATVAAATPVAKSGAYLPTLTAVAGSARDAATKLDQAVTDLDEAIEDVDAPSNGSAPVDSLPSNEFTIILDVLRALPGGVPRS